MGCVARPRRARPVSEPNGYDRTSQSTEKPRVKAPNIPVIHRMERAPDGGVTLHATNNSIAPRRTPSQGAPRAMRETETSPHTTTNPT